MAEYVSQSYLGRLPSEFVGFDPMVAFALPDD